MDDLIKEQKEFTERHNKLYELADPQQQRALVMLQKQRLEEMGRRKGALPDEEQE